MYKVHNKNTKLIEKFKKECQNQSLKYIKRMNKTELVQAFSYKENGGLNIVFKLAQPLTCMAFA